MDQIKTHLISIPPFHYLHVLDNNKNVTRLVTGPRTFRCLEHETVVFGPEKMIVVPPRHYCVIRNPVMKNEDGTVVLDQFGQCKLRHGDTEIRFEQPDPFPLYPGEIPPSQVSPFKVIPENTAIKLVALRPFKDGEVKREAGDEWLFAGPATYIPRIECDEVETLRAYIVKPNQALRLAARRDCVDCDGNRRRAGEEWLVRKEGAYIPGVDEIYQTTITGRVLTAQQAVQVKALKTFVDQFGEGHKCGDEWLVTSEKCEVYIPGVYEQIVNVVPLCSVTKTQYAVISNPVQENGKLGYGLKKLIRGEANFFMRPGEILQGIYETTILGEDQRMWVSANVDFAEQVEGRPVQRKAGSSWWLYGPCEYVPPLEVTLRHSYKAFMYLPVGGYFYNRAPWVLSVLLLILYVVFLFFSWKEKLFAKERNAKSTPYIK